MTAVWIGLLQGLGIIWILGTLVLLMTCTPSHWDAPISRYYPWWCAGWPLVIVALFGAVGLELLAMAFEAARDALMAVSRLFIPGGPLLSRKKKGPRQHTVPWLPGRDELPSGVVWALMAIRDASADGCSYREVAQSMVDALQVPPELARYYVSMAAELGLLRDVIVVEAKVGLRQGQMVCAGDVKGNAQ